MASCGAGPAGRGAGAGGSGWVSGVAAGSEAGAVVFDDANVTRKGRLGPGQMLSAAEVDASALKALQEQVKTLTEEVQRLKAGAPRDPETDDLMKQDLLKAKGLSIGFYGETKYRFPQSGANAFDAQTALGRGLL